MKRTVCLILLPVILATFLLQSAPALALNDLIFPPQPSETALDDPSVPESAAVLESTTASDPGDETESTTLTPPADPNDSSTTTTNSFVDISDSSTTTTDYSTDSSESSTTTTDPSTDSSESSTTTTDPSTNPTEPTISTEPNVPTEPITETVPTIPTEPVIPTNPIESTDTVTTTQPTEPPAPVPIFLSQTNVTYGVGEQFKLTAKDESGKNVAVTYTIAHPSLLTQTQPGSFTVRAAGTALITARAADGAEATCTVTILKAPKKILLQETEVTRGIGEEYTVVADVPAGSFTSKLRYASDNKHVLARVSGNTFRAKHSGTATVTVTAHNGVQAQCVVTVMKAPKKMTLSETELTLGVGESVRLTPELPEGTYSSDLRFSSSKKTVRVSETGKVTAAKKGKAVITVTTHNGTSATCDVRVLKAPKSIKLQQTLTLNPGDSYTFEPTLKKGYGAHTIKLRSSNKKVMRQTEGATFTARKVGTATVTATAYNGVSADCEVQVLRLPKKISFPQSYYAYAMGKRFTPQIILPENTYCASYVFTSSDPYVASVDETGAVWCRSVGSAVIRAEAPNGAVASCTVSVSSMPVPAVSQLPSYPTGCEAASCTALLRYYGYSITLSQMVATIPRENIVYRNGRRYGPDINKKFVGNPAGTYTSGTPGYGAFSPCIKKSLQKAIDDRNGEHKAKRISGCTFEELLEQLSKGRPAIVWATYQMMVPHSVNSWYIPQEDGTARYFQYPRGTHVFVLKGYSRNYVMLMDPYGGYSRTYSRTTFEARWNLLGKQAVVLV